VTTLTLIGVLYVALCVGAVLGFIAASVLAMDRDRI
jgi:hypothetical protein